MSTHSWDTVDMSVSSPSAKLPEIPELAHSLLLRQFIIVHQVMSFLARPLFLLMDVNNFASCSVIWSDILNVYHSPAHLFPNFYHSLLT